MIGAVRREHLVMFCYCDMAGQVRGKGFPASQLAKCLRATPLPARATCPLRPRAPLLWVVLYLLCDRNCCCVTVQ